MQSRAHGVSVLSADVWDPELGPAVALEPQEVSCTSSALSAGLLRVWSSDSRNPWES